MLQNVCIYCTASYFPEVQIFPNFPNGLMTQENLFWTADYFSLLSFTRLLLSLFTSKYLIHKVALVHKQAPHLLPASRCIVTTNERFYTDGTHPALTCTKVSHMIFSVGCCEFLNWENFCSNQENLHLRKITHYMVICSTGYRLSWRVNTHKHIATL